MAPLADFLLTCVAFRLPPHLSSYIVGETPLSTTPTVVSVLAGYLVVIFSIKALMTNREPYKLRGTFRVHNILLSFGNALLLVLVLEEIVPQIWTHGFFHALCAAESWSPRMEFYYMINHYFKYYELFDTVLLALKKKRLQFIYIFHHSATAFLAFVSLNGRISGSWTIVSINLAIHALLYYCFYATASSRIIWWKKNLTTLEIGQFIIALCVGAFGCYQRVAHHYFPHFPHIGDCAGDFRVAVFGLILLASYLGLFVNLYLSENSKRPAPRY